MPPSTSSIRLGGSALLRSTTATTSSATKTTTFSAGFASAARRAAAHESHGDHGDHGAHGSQYDPPSGWLFGVKPGEKYKPEGWERPFFWGFCGSLVVFACVYPFKPDTSIQTWALEEARRRLEAEGILEDPFPEKKQ